MPESSGCWPRCYEAKGMNREEIEELGLGAASYGHPEIAPRLRQSFAASGYRGALRRWARELDQLEEAGQFDSRNYLARNLPSARRSATRVKSWKMRTCLRNTRPAACGIDSDVTGRPEGHAKPPAVQLRPALSGPPATHRSPAMSVSTLEYRPSLRGCPSSSGKPLRDSIRRRGSTTSFDSPLSRSHELPAGVDPARCE